MRRARSSSPASGRRSKRARRSRRSLGAKRAIVLPVSVAAHSPLMADAATAMRAVLAGVPFADPTTTLLANADARPLTTGDACRAELVEHLTDGRGLGPGRRDDGMLPASTRSSRSDPGRVLTGLTKRIAADVACLALDDPSAPDRLAVPFAAPSPGGA